MNCQEAAAHLETWEVKALEAETELLVSQHLLGCSSCRRELARLRLIQDELPRALRRSEAEAALRPWGRLVPALALFLVAVLIGSQLPRISGEEKGAIPAVQPVVVSHSDDAVFEFVHARHISLRRGQLELMVAEDSLPFEVTTPLGHMHTTHAKFLVSMEEEDMDAKTLFGATGVLTVGVVIGAVVFGNDDGEQAELREGQQIRRQGGLEDPVAEKAVIPRRVAQEGDESGGRSEADVAHIEKLEAEIRALKESRAADRKSLGEMKDVLAKIKESQDKAGLNDVELGGRRKKMGPRDLAGVLGLESSREEALVQAYEKLQEKIRQEEKRYAKVEETEDGYKIEIPTWNDDWEKLKKGWRRDLAGILMADEMKKYEGQGLQRQLFREQGGDTSRSITISKGEGGYVNSETRKGNGMMMNMVEDGHATLDDALNGLTHLIDD